MTNKSIFILKKTNTIIIEDNDNRDMVIFSEKLPLNTEKLRTFLNLIMSKKNDGKKTFYEEDLKDCFLKSHFEYGSGNTRNLKEFIKYMEFLKTHQRGIIFDFYIYYSEKREYKKLI